METSPGGIEALAAQVLQAMANPSPQLMATFQQLHDQTSAATETPSSVPTSQATELPPQSQPLPHQPERPDAAARNQTSGSQPPGGFGGKKLLILAT